VSGTREYRIAWATNFDASFTQIIAASPNGYIDPAVNQATLEVVNGNGVRIVFDPTNAAFAITYPSSPFWLQFSRYDGNSVTYTSPPTLLLPFEANHGIGLVSVRGTAPNGASVANSLQIDLPGLMSDIRIHNEGSNPLFVAPEANAAEVQYPTGQVGTFVTAGSAQSSLLVRGGGGTTVFSAAMTRAIPR
jgi:hypothetical protein